MKKIAFLWICLTLIPNEIYSANFTRNSETAQQFGVHEISLSGNGSVPNPFDTPCEVTFTPPSGTSGSITVNAFYDGNNTWRARCYITETGEWSWESVSSRDFGLDQQSGLFSAVESELRGMLRIHPKNSKALATDDGRWFLNIGDTPYFLFHDEQVKWQEFIKDSWNKGITLVRASMIGGLLDWRNRLFEDGNHDKLNISNFQTNDKRLIWMADNVPDLYMEFILFGECNTGWTGDETFWHALSSEQHSRILKYIVARYAAFPEIIWEVANDYAYSEAHPNNVEMANEAGNYLLSHDPWNHLITTGGIRGDDFYFTDTKWVSLFHLETLDALPADQVNDYTDHPVHIFNAEDRYETYREPDHPAIYFRRLIWAWTLSGGSACYGGDWDTIVPYSESTFEGLDNIIHIRNFFNENSIDLSEYFTDDNSVSSGARGTSRPKVMRAQEKSDYIIYHPNASMNGQGASISAITASLTINDLPAADYSLLWMRADNGVQQESDFYHEGGSMLLISPWPGIDVILYLHLQTAADTDSPSSSLTIENHDLLSVQPNPFSTSTSVSVRLTDDSQVCLDVFNMQGQYMEQLVCDRLTSGVHSFIWNANNYPEGIYFMMLKRGSSVCFRKINLLR